MFDPRLIREINRRNCLLLIGSGPSTEVGFSSWALLARSVYEEVKRLGKISDDAGYQKYLAEQKYPEMFAIAERDLGDRASLVSMLQHFLEPRKKHPAHIYGILANWPIPIYMTTNWDDEILNALGKEKVFFKTVWNTKADFSKWRAGTDNIIVKLHSDLAHPETAVITSRDYQIFSTDGSFEYFRAKLRAVFEMFNVLIIGHSLSDYDLSLVLQIAKSTSSPEHPLYLVAADMTRSDEIELFQKFNIVVIPYKNPDGTHSRLRRLLCIVNKFVKPRYRRLDIQETTYSDEEIEAAQSLLIYRRVHNLTQESTGGIHHFDPLVLNALFQVSDNGVDPADLFTLPPLSTIVKNDEIKTAVEASLQLLQEEGLIAKDGKLKLLEAGTKRVMVMRSEKEMTEEQAYGQFILDLKSELGSNPEEKDEVFVDLLKDTIVKVFKQRGLAIANSIFADQSISERELSDIFEALSNAATVFHDEDASVAFIAAAQKFVLESSTAQLKYLTSLSQGYFLFHLLGLDPKCAKIRHNILQNTVWWCDASTLLPLLAAGSRNNEYAKDLFRRLRELNVRVVTTTKFLSEIHRHILWAHRFFEEEDTSSPVFLQAALLKSSFKQNLFLEGFIRLAAEGAVGTPADYLNSVFPDGWESQQLRRLLQGLGISVIELHELEGYAIADHGTIQELTEQVKDERIRGDSYKGWNQVDAEGEILFIIRSLRSGRYKSPVTNQVDRAYFLSQSLVLDRVAEKNEGLTWTPEALYRYLIALPGETPDDGLLHQCMLQEYYVSGIVLIDKQRYRHFFGPAINAAKISYAAEEAQYLREYPQASAAALRESFDKTPDLEKPFFVTQMGWKAARQAAARAESATRRAVESEAELKRVRAAAETGALQKQLARLEQSEAEARHGKDPKYLRKKLRQAKKRQRRGRK
jgi:hypothetical protein